MVITNLMGLRNALRTWQRLKYNVFNGLVGTECLVYLDDAIIFSSNNIQEHLERLRNVFIRIRESNLKFKSTKCNFLLKEAKYLGTSFQQKDAEQIQQK